MDDQQCLIRRYEYEQHYTCRGDYYKTSFCLDLFTRSLPEYSETIPECFSSYVLTSPLYMYGIRNVQERTNIVPKGGT